MLGGILLVTGACRRKPRLTIAGAVLSSSFCLYVSLHPAPVRWLAIAALAGNFLSIRVVKEYGPSAAIGTLAPYAVLLLLVFYAVVSD